MYGTFVRDKFPDRHHLSSILDIEIAHGMRRRHAGAWIGLLALTAAAAGAGAWYGGLLPH